MSNDDNAKERTEGEAASLCPECPAGIMRLNYITYFTWLDGELVTVPNFPAWICDVCGRREFDPRAVTWLNTLLSPSAGKTSARRQRRRNSAADSDWPQL